MSVSFQGCVQINYLNELVQLEREILNDHNYPLSYYFFDPELVGDEEVMVDNKKFKSGLYFISYDNERDRMGTVETRVLFKIEQPICNLNDLLKQSKPLLERLAHLRHKFADSLDRQRQKNQDAEKDITIPELQEIDNLTDQLNAMCIDKA